VTDADFRGLWKLRDAAGRQFAAGVVLYDGGLAVRFEDDLFAVPMRALWEHRRREPSVPLGTRMRAGQRFGRDRFVGFESGISPRH
jgi:hypothetical protein